MTSKSQNVYNDKLDDTVNEYNSTYHRAIEMKPKFKMTSLTDVKSSTYIDFDQENTKEDHKFEVGDHVRISKYKNIFAKGYIPNFSEDVFVVKKAENTGHWKTLMVKKLLERFVKKNCKRICLKWKRFLNRKSK